MKKQIVINASKDRSRIAIVENGELVELYIENPDNVRSIGNIYLGSVQKVMPAIRAAFVDVGEKQDCFLHFSDLTDNFPQLLALAGEDVPGLDEPVLSMAPAKRVADDDSEPDVEDSLEIASAGSDDEDEKTSSTSKRRRSRRRSRGRGRGRGGKREEEEEQEEDGERRRLPAVLDLTSPPKRRPARAPKPDPEPATEPAPEPEVSADEAEAPAPRRSRRKAADAPAPEAEVTASADADALTDDAPSEDAPSGDAQADAQDEPARKRRRRGRRGRGKKTQDDASTDGDGRADAEDAPEAGPAKTVEDAPDDMPKRSRRRAKKAAPTADADETSDANPSADDAAPADTSGGRKRLPSTLDLTGAAKPRPSSRRTSSDDRSTDRSDGDDAPSRGRGRSSDESGESTGRSRRRSGTSKPSVETEAAEPKASDEARKDGGRGERSRRGDRSKGSGRDTSGDQPTSDDKQGGRRGGDRDRSGRSAKSGDRGRSKGNGRSRGSGKKGPIPPSEELLKRDTRVIVKVTKEAISNKGPRVSTDLSLAGRFLVLVPAADYVAVSKKIESAKERRRLRTLATSLKPDGFGVIVRTVAEGRDAKSLDTDLRLLADRWRKIEKKLNQNPDPPVLLYQDVNMVSSIIRDLFSDDFDRILVDDPKVFKNVQTYIKAVAPDMADKVEMHKGRQPVFRSLGIEKQVEEAFSKRVNMKGGGYLFIETTEAMHVVDVNSGRAGRGKSQKQNLIDVNVAAAHEIAKQLRLRDLGGIIVVDFIDLRYDRDRRKVTDALKKEFEKDRAVTKLLPMSDFGLVQITRQRLRPSITTQATDDDGEPLDAAEAKAAAGAGEISTGQRPEPEPEREPRRDERPERAPVAPEDATPQALSGRLKGWLDHYRRTVDERYKARPIVVRVHPLFGAYLRRGFPSPLTRWRLSLRGITFAVEEDATVDPLAFEVRDQKSGRSLLKKYSQ